MELSKTYTFEASHVLPKHPGKCSRLHGHSWVLKVCVEGSVNNDTGFVMDYADISARVKPLIERLDHRHLGAWCIFGKDRHQAGNLELVAEIWGDTSNSDPLIGEYFHSWFVPGLPLDIYPSSENMLFWIGEQLADMGWSQLELDETCTSSCKLTRKEYDDRKAGLGWKRREEVL